MRPDIRAGPLRDESIAFYTHRMEGPELRCGEGQDRNGGPAPKRHIEALGEVEREADRATDPADDEGVKPGPANRRQILFEGEPHGRASA